ncbi:MAG TPA: serine/threonine-protein kinase [Planctomycetota bacterium]|nr:serine/threonine-protein kinase [Planctomycetota bacterium]
MTSPARPNSPTEQPAKKTRRLGDYELVGKLGQGAMGSVYLANRMSTGQKVAIKILPHELARDDEFLERFRREARAALKISHPNVVAAYDVGVADNYNYIALEYIDGPNLELLLNKKGRLSEAEILRITLDISQALQAAEEKGIVHRDIKPANILMNSQGISKLTDLGLASASKGDQRVTMAGFAVGTPFYISPEQARGDLDVDCRSDIYSLGATLYHLSTGTLPFPGNNPVLIMTKHLQEMPPPPDVRQPGVSPRISAMIMKMMAKDPADRYQNAAELKADIERMINGENPFAVGAGGPAKPPPLPAKSAARHSGRRGPVLVQSGPPKSTMDQLFELPDRILPFLPMTARLPVFAVALTVFFLALVFALVMLVK